MPAALAWWQWLLAGMLGLVVAGVCWSGAQEREEMGERSALLRSVAFMVGLPAFLGLVIGVIRFVKWVWQ